MLIRSLRRVVRSVLAALREAQFWEWLIGIVLLGVLIGTMLWFAVSRHDAFLRMKPMLCSEGLADRQFVFIAMAAPVSVLLMLAAIGELWEQLENRRRGAPIRWRYLAAFAGLASGLAVLVLLFLRC